MEQTTFSKIFFIILWVSAAIVVLGGVLLILPQLLIYLGLRSSGDTSRPEITHGEFPFRLEYELDGELNVIEDTLIVEFDGFGTNAGTGRYRRWRSHLASGANLILLLEVSDYKQIFYFPGSARYYMGDSLHPHSQSFPNASFIEREQRITRRDIEHSNDMLERFGPLENNSISEENLLENYGIRLISWEIAEPIINNFGD